MSTSSEEKPGSSNLRKRGAKLADVADTKTPQEGPKVPRRSISLQQRQKAQRATLVFSLLLSLAFFFYRPAPKPLAASYVLCCRSGSCINTVDQSNPVAECVAVHHNKFVGIGTRKSLKKIWQSIAPKSEWVLRYVEYPATVVPGFSDSHAHVLEYGATRQLPVEKGNSVQEAVAIVRDYIVANEDVLNDTTRYIDSWGWDHMSWPVQKFPTAADLEADPITRGRPIILASKDGHSIWVSKSILDANAPYPESVDGGVIVRDENGRPTGCFLDNAQDLVKRPQLPEVDLQRRFKATVDDALAVGLTSIHDAGLKPESLAFFKREAERNVLPVRLYAMTYFNESADYWGDKESKVFQGGKAGRLDSRSVKIFADGALRSGGAALHAPYHDSPDTAGFLCIDEKILRSVIPKFLRDGWQNVHAIGDRANAIVVDAFESALSGANVTALRPRLEHAQIMTKYDMARLSKLGVIASVQPTHAISDMWYAQDRLGPERVKILYAFRTLIDSGARVTFGSDFPVEDINPIAGFYAAVTRLSPSGTSPHGPEGWFPDQKLTRMEALRGYTIDPAYASYAEQLRGTIEVGKLADFVVLSQDILTVKEADILSTKVLATVIDGRAVYGKI